MTDGEGLIRSVLALADVELRRGYVHALLRAACASKDVAASRRGFGVAAATESIEHVAEVLESVCQRAEAADPRAEATLLSIVDALFFDRTPLAFMLRAEAQRCGHWSLERLLRYSAEPLGTLEQRRRTRAASSLATEHPSAPGASAAPVTTSTQKEAGIPDYGKGRPLALGERKALARKPTRALMDRLLCDPHPDVVRRLLANPRLTEDDVVRLASRRQRKPEVLIAVAESPRWLRSRRVRVALACNPDSPLTVGIRVVQLLLRADLALVASSPKVGAQVRSVCFELLKRRPPLQGNSHPLDPEKLH
jgi:hypothetical protein